MTDYTYDDANQLLTTTTGAWNGQRGDDEQLL